MKLIYESIEIAFIKILLIRKLYLLLPHILDKVPARLNIGLMLFFSIFFLYVVRSHFSINLLAMVEPTTTDENGTIIQLPDVSA